MNVRPTTMPIDQSTFRKVLGHLPTGVSVITATTDDGPAGLLVGTLTSVSLDPPLVGFFPDRRSQSWPRMREVGTFCANVLADDQEAVSQRFAVSGGDKFAGMCHAPGRSGAPRLDGALAWIDCEVEAEVDAGDHTLVLGRVTDLDTARTVSPLIFFRGGYRRLAP